MTGDAQAVFERYRGHEDDAAAQDRLWAELATTVLADAAVPFDEHWSLFRSVFADRAPEDGPPIAWRPGSGATHIDQAMADVGLTDYASFHEWSVSDRAAFWELAMRRLGIPLSKEPDTTLAGGPEDPQWLPGARMNIAEACFRAPEGRVAIRFHDGQHITETTYGDLRRHADAVAHHLVDKGLRPGDAVALYMPMDVSCVAWYLGIVLAGMSVVSIADSFAAPEVASRLRIAQAKAIVTVESFQRAGKAVPLGKTARQAAGGLPVLLASDVPQGQGRFDAHETDPEDVTNILFSSGTTGDPKAIPWTHLTPIKAAADGHFHQDIHPEDVVAWPTNIGWMMGPWLIYATFVNQATMALYADAPTGQAFVDAMDDMGVTVLGVVPAIVRSWMAQAVPPRSLPTVRVFSSTGEASNARDYLYLMSLAGYRAPVIEYCGGTEIGGGHLTGTLVQPASPATFTTPALGLDFVVLGEDDRPVAPGEHGQIYLVPPSIGLSQRLLNRDHHEEYYAGCPTGPHGQVLRRHGDEVHVMHNGFWAAGGRADDTMNLGGIKVSSVELENAMNGAGGVTETAAVAIPPEGGGADRLVVFAVLDGPEPPDLKATLQARIKERLNPLFRIHDLVITHALPRTASNKVMRRKLRDEYQA